MSFPTSNKVLSLESYDLEKPGSTLRVVEQPIPEPREGEVLVNITLRPINPADLFSIGDVYPGFAPGSLPAVVGLDGVGLVVKSGPGASAYKPGARVVAAPWPTKAGNGTWQQYVVMPEALLQPVPEGLSDEAASQFLVNPVTVYGFVKTLESDNLIKTGWIVSNAAGSALGRMFIAYAKHKGLRTIALVRREALREELLSLGAEAVVVTGEDVDVEAEIKKITGGKGADAAFECVGGDVSGIVKGLRRGGALIIYGAMGEFSFTTAIPDVLFRGITVRGFWLSDFLADTPVEERATVVREVFEAMLEGTLAIPPGGKHFTFEDVEEAIVEATKPGRGGKAFLKG